MSERPDVARYFSRNARGWMARAYGEGGFPSSYPVGSQRLRLTLEAVVERLGGAVGHLVDLGCGGGELAVQAAALGFGVTAVDIAPGMIEEAGTRRAALTQEAQRRLRLQVGDVLDSGLAAGAADAVTAIGLVEYLPGDAAFFREAARLLRPGGVLVMSCRNRLFNLASLNDYTRGEIDEGAAVRLLAELGSFPLDGAVRDRLKDFVARLREALPDLEAALGEDLEESARGGAAEGFAGRRRQHTPAEVREAAAAAGLSDAAFLGVHPHPFPPAVESLAPRFYNRLAVAYEALEAAPASLGWSSAFLAVFTRQP